MGLNRPSRDGNIGAGLGDNDSVSNLLQRKHVFPVTRSTGPASAPPFQ
jgi:hypothetical protein